MNPIILVVSAFRRTRRPAEAGHYGETWAMKLKPRFHRQRAMTSLALGLAVLSASCTVGPDYRRPPVTMPSVFKERPSPESTLAAEWRTARPSDDAIRAKWWEAFQDPLLSSLIEQVAISNQTVAQAEAQFRAARAAIRNARADRFPTVTAGASATRSRSSGTLPGAVPVAVGTINDYQLPIDSSYEADLWGRVRRNVESSVASAQASSADVQTALLSSQAELALDYFELRGLDAQIALLQATLTAYERALQLTVARHDQGVASGVDVAQAQTQLDTTRVQATDLQIARAQFEHAIAILIGKAPADLAIPSAVIDMSPPAVPLALPSQLVERRPDVAAAERRVAAANAQIGVAQAAFFPTLALTASGGLESSTLNTLLTLPSRFWAIGPALAQTVFDGGRRRSVKEQALAAYDGTVALYRQSTLTAFQDVEDNLAALRVLADEAVQARAAVTSANRSLELANNQYVGGVTTYLEVITAQTAALANQITAANVLTRRMTASVLLIKALGGGWSTAELVQVHDLRTLKP
jgi:NodT family efflux transporter outer membrane factor (OMF) lipoprotein